MIALSAAAMGSKGAESHLPAVELHTVSKSYGAVQALHEVSYAVPQGQVVALLGPNGAGKTTAISVMLGLRRPSHGPVRLLGRDPHDRRARSQCGIMLQDSGVPLTLTVREIITLFRSYYARPLPVARVLEMAGLTKNATAAVGALSGGQRQRLFFALAMCGDPAILFLDEPTAGLDVEARHSFWNQMRSFVQQGKTILLTTHYLEEADAPAERIIVIDHGHVRAHASPAAGPSLQSRRYDHGTFPVAQLGTPPTLYISLSTTFNNQVAFYQQCFAAFADTAWQVVLSYGTRIERAALGAIPRDFLVAPQVPQLEILPRMDVFLSHGGMNSVMESLSFGVPLVVVPQILEQKVTARRVQELGLGLALDTATVAAEHLRAAVAQVAHDPTFRTGAQAMRQMIQEAGGYHRAVEAISSFAHARKQTTHGDLRA
jgi:ABC-2 type transport system ATP-binding protein